MAKRSKRDRPIPPEDLEGEALLEWERVCDALQAAGRLAKSDRAIILAYAQAWATNQACFRHVARFGAVIKWPNGLPGPSPQYKAYRETSALIRGYLSDLGLTPTARATAPEPAQSAGNLDF